MSKRARIWPAIAIVAVLALILAFTWLWSSDSSEQIRQSKVLLSASVLALGAILLVLWAAMFSRLPLRMRASAIGGFLLVIVGFLVLFRYRGVSGDLVPQFDPRFRARTMNLPDVDPKSLPAAASYPQFLGPDRNAVLDGPDLARDWARDPPKVLWRRPVGRGWSGFAVSGTSAVTQEQHSAEERVVSYELSSGRAQWASRQVAHYANALAGEGPRATPTIAEGRIYAMGGTGILTVLDLESGELVWKRDVLRDAEAKLQVWGKSDSPLVVGDRVIVHAGEGRGTSLVAYYATDGSLAWMSGKAGAGYASPTLLTLAGVEQVVSFNHSSVSGHDPSDGRLLWEETWSGSQPNVSQPLLIPADRLLVSAGYGVGSKLIRIVSLRDGRLEAELVWESLRLKAKFANLVYHDGFVYGLDDGILVCLDPENGRRRWKGGRYGHGQVILVGELLLVQTEHGEIVLVNPTPGRLDELTRFRIMDAKIWNPPALAGHYLLVRNDEEAALVDLPLEEASARAYGRMRRLPRR